MRFVLALLALSLMPLSAQDQAASYKVDYVIKEANAQPRRYAVLIERGSKGNFRVGTRQPYLSGANQYQYADVGVNIDVRLSDSGRGLTLDTGIEISSMMSDSKTAPAGALPVIAQIRTNVTNLMPVGKPLVIATIDDPVTLKKFEIEATLSVVK